MSSITPTEDLSLLINNLRGYLPIQFPLGVFIHNNMLMFFENKHFEQGIRDASYVYGSKLSLDESYYLELNKKNRIEDRYFIQGLTDFFSKHGEFKNWKLDTSIEWAKYLMLNPFSIPHRVSPDEFTIRHDWQIYQELADKIHTLFEIVPKPVLRKKWKVKFKEVHGEEANSYFHSLMIRFLSSYLDQGLAIWHNPDFHGGMVASFKGFLGANLNLLPEWFHSVFEESQKWDKESRTETIARLLQDLEVEDSRDYLLATLIELKGWAGMVNKFEREPQLIPRNTPKVSLEDYLVIYLTLEKTVANFLRTKYATTLKSIEHQGKDYWMLEKEHVAYVLAKFSEISGKDLTSVSLSDLEMLVKLFIYLAPEERGMIWHMALDFSLRDQFLDTISSTIEEKKEKIPPIAQMFFCIDDREESIRRHLEEINSKIETFGVVGFFGLDMKVQSINHPEAAAQCPPVVTPSKVILETLSKEFAHEHNHRLNRRTKFGKSHWDYYYRSRGSSTSFFTTLLSAPFSFVFLALRVFFPIQSIRMYQKIKSMLVPDLPTQYEFCRLPQSEAKIESGYNYDEMSNIVATILRFTGKISHFSDFVFMVGHGASSSNNPFRQAYGCGACGGKAGSPNSKIFCQMANLKEVREALVRNHNIVIPEKTLFLSCFHDTSTDEISCYNSELVLAEKKNEFKILFADLQRAARINSQERSRHFDRADHLSTEKQTFGHVKTRAANLAEPRPEYGHTNNSICVIGSREITRGLYLDRRSFLTSYDPATDPSGDILAQVMAGAVPVAAGINLDYYFSRVDNENYGCGTKLPLNITSLVGVMSGSQSDLRVGLAKQMVELHEPARITFLIHATPEVVMGILNKAPRQKNIVINEWCHFCLYHPHTHELLLLQKGVFVPYKSHPVDIKTIIGLSRDYVLKKKGPIPFARLSHTGPRTVV